MHVPLKTFSLKYIPWNIQDESADHVGHSRLSTIPSRATQKAECKTEMQSARHKHAADAGRGSAGAVSAERPAPAQRATGELGESQQSAARLSAPPGFISVQGAGALHRNEGAQEDERPLRKGSDATTPSSSTLASSTAISPHAHR